MSSPAIRTEPDSSSPSPPALRLSILYPIFFVAVYLSHWTLLRLPYFWDEGGYYIPAALDFFRTGALIPRSTLTNAHPPLPSILLAAWWHLSGFVISGTRTFLCIVSAAALLAVFRLSRRLAGDLTAAVVTLLTAAYPIWFAQSTLAHADIFAAAFTLWALSFYLAPEISSPARRPAHRPPARTPGNLLAIATLFSLAVLSKETAIVTPAALALLHLVHLVRHRSSPPGEPVRPHLELIAALLAPILPLVAWYAYHFHRTGFVFGNPEFLRYNATANLDASRVALSLWHRTLHLTMHMNLFVPVLSAAAAALSSVLPSREHLRLPRTSLLAIASILLANLVAFSILGGALLTRYLLPMYPLILLVCVVEWRRHLRLWWAVAALSLAAFTAAIWLNPPYAFAPEDNLTYRAMVLLHQQAISLIARQFPHARVLTAWPATGELERPELGYTRTPIATHAIPDLSPGQLRQSAADPAGYDTALLFSTKWEPRPGQINFGASNETADSRYFDFHHDLQPEEAASLLHGTVVWEAHRQGGWVAVLRFRDPQTAPTATSPPSSPR